MPNLIFILVEAVAQIVPGNSEQAGGCRNISIALVDSKLNQSQNFFLQVEAFIREAKIFVEPITLAGGIFWGITG